MLTLNLVSANLKKEVRLKRIYGLLRKFNAIFIIITIAVSIILLSAKILLQNNFNKVVEQTTLVTQNNLGYNNQVREINLRLNNVAKIQDNFTPWSRLIIELADMTPANVRLTSLKISRNDKTIVIKGRAGLRDDLLELKAEMENYAVFEQIDFPLTNILTRENIDFSIEAKINPDEI